MTDGQCEIGMVGLGVMGSNYVKNMADHGFAVAGYDKSPEKIQRLKAEAPAGLVHPVDNVETFLHLLKPPKTVMLLVPAGPPVDAVIHELLPHLHEGDIIIDGGNSHFSDTNIRQKALAGHGVDLLGVGISGGEEGARRGPCLMPGGPRRAYDRVRPIFEATAAQINGDPCVAYLGPGSAGHYVKMVHNGIEYGLMQLVSECYDLLKRGMGYDNDELAATFSEWNRSELNGYLVEITAKIFKYTDPNSGKRLIDLILDVASQKGTGKWTVQDAVELNVPTPLTATAVNMRDLSVLVNERREACRLLAGPRPAEQKAESQAFRGQLRNALYAAMVLTFTQGLALLSTASKYYDYNLPLEAIARIWRGGCIIRAAMLEQIALAYQQEPSISLLFLDKDFAGELSARQEDLRRVVETASSLGIPAPGMMSTLGYYDSFRSGWLPANLIQAQRDYFGAHAYERIDEKGHFSTKWE